MAKINEERRGQYIQTALKIIHENGGQMVSRDVIAETGKRLNLTDYEKERYDKTGYVRWESILHFISIGCIKAGWLRKKQGIWYITDEGVEKLKLSALEFKKQINQKYREWKVAQGEEVVETQEESDENIAQKTAFDQALTRERGEIEDYIKKLDPYLFQDLAAALLRGMGY